MLDLVVMHLESLHTELRKTHASEQMNGGRILTIVRQIRSNESLRARYEVIYGQAVVLLVSYFASALADVFRTPVNALIERGDSNALLDEDVKLTFRDIREKAWSLMMGRVIPEHLRQIARKVATHEAGHYVISRVHGFEAGDCTATILNINGAHRGGSATTLVRPLASLSDVVGYLQQRIQILYAGALAESLDQLGRVNNDVALEAVRTRAPDDHSKVRELTNLLRNISHQGDNSAGEAQAQLDAIDSAMWNATTKLVERSTR